MNSKFEKNGYLILKNLIPQALADYCTAVAFEMIRDGRYVYAGVPPHEHSRTWNVGGHSCTCHFANNPFYMLLYSLTPKISEILEQEIVPTYCYQRTYLRGSLMAYHTDRASSQYALTMNLGQSHKWSISIVNRSTGKHDQFQGNPGDAMLYMGTALEHHRNNYDGDWYTQLMMMWVNKEGYIGPPFDNELCKEHHYDKKVHEEAQSPEEAKNGYLTNWREILYRDNISNVAPFPLALESDLWHSSKATKHGQVPRWGVMKGKNFNPIVKKLKDDEPHEV
jgi:hypothetical protein